MLRKLTKMAKVVNSLRVFPRIMIGIYLFLLVWVSYWFMALPEPTTEQMAFATAVVAAGAAWFPWYVKSGAIETLDESDREHQQ